MSWGDFLLGLLMLVGIFLMFVILLQRGRGGGLAGAFGGLGGQSAFGTKAGDVFTVITIVTVVLWVVLACVAGARLRYEANAYMLDHPDQDEVKKAGAEEGAGAAAGDAGDDENRDVQEGAGKPGAEKPAADKPGKEKQGTKAGPRAPPEGKSDDGTSKNEADGSDSRKSESSPEN